MGSTYTRTTAAREAIATHEVARTLFVADKGDQPSAEIVVYA